MGLTVGFLLNLGFKEKRFFPLLSVFVLDLGRGRKLELCNPATPNEMLLLTSVPTDQAVLHNWDYDGPLTQEKVKTLLKFFDKNEQEEIKSVHPHPYGKDPAS